MRNVNPASVKKPIVIDPLAAVKRGLRNKLTSSIGRAIRRSTLMNAARRTRPAAMVPSVRVDPHPQFGPWMMLRTSVPIAALDRSSPGQSIGGGVGSLEEGTEKA